MASVPYFSMLSMQNRQKTGTNQQALDQPIVELRATCTELGLEFVVPTPFKAPETHSLRGLTAALGTALLSDKSFNLGTATGADRFNELCRERSSILAERHDFYIEVQQRFEGMAQSMQLMQRDYYREIDFLREQISRLRKQPEHEVPKVTFFGRHTYEIPAWQDIVDMLDERRMRRELNIKDDEPILTKVPLQMVCPSCRSHFTKGTFPDPSPCEAAMQTEELECCDAQTSTSEHRRTGTDVASNCEQEKLIEELRSQLTLEKSKNRQLTDAAAQKLAMLSGREDETNRLGTPATTKGSSPRSVESESSFLSVAKTSSTNSGLAASQLPRTGCRRLLRRALNAFQLTTRRGRTLRSQQAMSRRWREMAAYENYIKRMMFSRWRNCTTNVTEEGSRLSRQKGQTQKDRAEFLSAPQTQLDGSSDKMQLESNISERTATSSPLETTHKQLEQRAESEVSTGSGQAFPALLGQERYLTVPGKHKIRDRDLVKSPLTPNRQEKKKSPFVASASNLTSGLGNSSSVADRMQNPQVPMETMWGTKYHHTPSLANSRSAGALVRSPCIHVVKHLSLELDVQGTVFGRSRSQSTCSGSRQRLPPSLSPVASPTPSPARVGSQGIRSGFRAVGC